jgi:hypothetical protein
MSVRREGIAGQKEDRDGGRCGGGGGNCRVERRTSMRQEGIRKSLQQERAMGGGGGERLAENMEEQGRGKSNDGGNSRVRSKYGNGEEQWQI